LSRPTTCCFAFMDICFSKVAAEANSQSFESLVSR
jgi:hypothetical protein